MSIAAQAELGAPFASTGPEAHEARATGPRALRSALTGDGDAASPRDRLAWAPPEAVARRRRAVLVPIVVFHGLLLWALLRSMAPAPAAPTVLTFVQLLPDAGPRLPATPPPRLSVPEPKVPPPTWMPWPEVTVTPTPAPTVAADAAPPPAAPAPLAAAADPAPAASSPAPVRTAAPERQVSITEVAYLTPPVLDYPLTARRRREEGVVHVRVRVDAGGRPDQALVIRSSGHDALDRAALATVRATRFKPYTEDGVPRPFWVVMPLVFELES